MSGRLRSDHGDIHIRGRRNAAEMNVEAVCEHKHVALFKVGLDALFVYLCLKLVIDEDHDDVSLLRSFRYGVDFHALLLGLCP